MIRVDLNHAGIHALKDSLKAHVSKCVEKAIEETRPHIHVDTGRLQASLRAIEPEDDGDTYLTGAVMGGVRMRGVVREQGIEKDVDYGLYEEIRHPQLRENFIPNLMENL
jgi:hypothetical protein